MKYRTLGKTGLPVSEIGFGGEWLEGKTPEQCRALIERSAEHGINICDCWMSDPEVRSNLGGALHGMRDRWYIQGHIGSTWQNGQYVRSRDMSVVRPAFEDLLSRLRTDYIDLGMIHYIDGQAEWDRVLSSDFLDYVLRLRDEGRILHIGLSTHNPRIAKQAAESGLVEMIMFSVNPLFDMLPPTENIEDMFAGEFDESLGGIIKERADLYAMCERMNIGITVMKGFAGGRLLYADRSPFGVALTPAQCLHYALTRPAVCSVMVGFSELSHIDEAVSYETASDAQRDYASVLAGAKRHAFRDMRGICTYCGHCQPCPSRIDIAAVNKLCDLAVLRDSVPQSVSGHYADLERHASDCAECGGCMTRCPFGVDIIGYMRRAREVFKK